MLRRRAMDVIELCSPKPVSPLAAAELFTTLADRPRERLLRCGSQSIGDAELIALILGTGVRDHPVLAVATELVHEIGGVASLSRASPHELAQIRGVGVARAARIAAAFELGRRAVELLQHRVTLASPEDLFHCVAPRFAGVTQEVLLVAGVDIRNGVLDIVEVCRGSLAHVDAHPRDVFRPLIRMAAAGAVLVHNHPSGDPTPSEQDRLLTRHLREVGWVLGIPIIDHVIIGDGTFRSLAEWMGVDF
ncbi:MAG TPA: DNA repair protein RadC [Kofleriaceae bacterium]|nr:DNA repair protein RadC [Kofleriaceae bacterium]